MSTMSGPSIRPTNSTNEESFVKEWSKTTAETSDGTCEKCRAYFFGYAGNIRRMSQVSINRLLGYAIPKPRVVPRQIPYGRLESLFQRKDCQFCIFLFQLINAEIRSSTVDSQEVDSGDICFVVPDKETVKEVYVQYKNVSVALTFSRKSSSILRDLHFLQGNEPSWSDMEGCESVSIGMIKGWLDGCQKPRGSSSSGGTFLHSKCHLPLSYTGGPWKLTFIDAIDRCLVPGNTSQKYFALSYVWGQNVDFLKTTTNNIWRPREKQSLTREEGVPTLVDDAIELTKSLGVRYIWVDALCLVQDDAASKYAGIRIMHIIYAHANLTIVAASAKSAFSSLSGLRNGTRSPLFSRVVKGKQLQRTAGVARKEITESIYQSRGWTMQEFLMSRRCLVFTYDQVYYRCPSAVVSELALRPRNLIKSPSLMLRRAQLQDLGLFSDLDPGSGPHTDIASNESSVSASSFDYDRAYPNFKTYMFLVGRYSCRQLSYQSDILNAFSAMQSALGLQMNCHFEFGLPLSAFGMALLWRPGALRPRRRDQHGQGSPGVFPTWSWVGWMGEVLWVEPVAPDRHSDIRQTFKELVPFSKLTVVGTASAMACEAVTAANRYDCLGPRLHRTSGSLVFEAEVVRSRGFRYREVRRHANHKGRLEILPVINSKGNPQNESLGVSGPMSESRKEMYRRWWEGSDDGLGRGIVFGMEAEEFEQSDCLDFVALSTFHSPRIWQGYPGLYYHFNEDAGEDQKGLPFLNCLVVKWCGDYAERVGIAQIGSLLWKDAGPNTKRITLR